MRNPGVVRELVSEALTDEEVRDLCFDKFWSVYDELSPAMSRKECIRRLLDYCVRRPSQLEVLLVDLERMAPEVYTGYRARLDAPYEPPSEPLTNKRIEPLSPCIVHPLPPAPTFLGRVNELRALHEFVAGERPGLLAMVGIGGAGKTAIVQKLLDELLADPQGWPDGLFVWSFYVSQDVNAFLETAYQYFSRGEAVHASGPANYFNLINILERNPGRPLIVIDGLERVQRPQSDAFGAFGDLTDPSLAQVVARLAAGLGRTKVIVTTRFPLVRLEPWRGRGFTQLAVDQLEIRDAIALLRRHGVRGDDAALLDLIDGYGAHALTLDHLGGYLHEYGDDDPGRAKALPEPSVESVRLEERRLSRVLHAYETALSPPELALLSRLAVFRFGTSARRLYDLFAATADLQIAGPLKGQSEAEIGNMLKHLLGLHLVLKESDREFTVHPAVRDHFYRGFANPTVFHQAVRRHFSSLVGRPGTALPDDLDTVDLLEELIYHTLKTNGLGEAEEIYRYRLGGYQHLAWNLGQFSRCIRILNQFPRCPDLSGLRWCYRAVGDLDAVRALIDPDDTWWLGMIGCLRSRFRETANLLAGNRDDPILAIARTLSGQERPDVLSSTPVWLGLPISPAECYIQAGRLDEAESYVRNYRATIEHEQRGYIWNDELARCDLTEAEIHRQRGELEECQRLVDQGMKWVLRSGSQEHLCLLSLARARLEASRGNTQSAEGMLGEGLHVAEQCGLGYYHIELLIEQADLALAKGQFSLVVDSCCTALNGMLRSTRGPAPIPNLDVQDLILLGANHPSCQYAWGAARASFLFGQALNLQGKSDESRKVHESLLDPMKRLGHPWLDKLESSLKSMA